MYEMRECCVPIIYLGVERQRGVAGSGERSGRRRGGGARVGGGAGGQHASRLGRAHARRAHHARALLRRQHRHYGRARRLVLLCARDTTRFIDRLRQVSKTFF
jgi:hypothetical protein